jgi:hypothetical protein
LKTQERDLKFPNAFPMGSKKDFEGAKKNLGRNSKTGLASLRSGLEMMICIEKELKGQHFPWTPF